MLFGTPVRAVFFGTPDISVPSLDALAEAFDVVGVVCQPDRPAGRGMQLKAPAVKERALELGLDVYQPEKVRDGSLARYLEERSPDFALVIAYGRILDARVLGAPRLGCVNLHASLLPLYRGAAPIQRALMDGQGETGVCLMQMDTGMDTGPVLATHSIPIESSDDAGSLFDKLASLAAEVTRVELPRFVRGELHPVAQEHARATHAPPIERADTWLDPNRSATALVNQVRGLSPRPGARATIQRGADLGRGLRIARAHVELGSLPVGRVQIAGDRILLGTGDGLFAIDEAQLEGRKLLGTRDLISGRALQDGDLLALPRDPTVSNEAATKPGK